ncbi:MAG: Rnf-Nqr domain containing protein [Candidatus Ornithospirochaeta sp.]
MEEKDRKILVEMIFLGLTPALAATINTVSAFTMGVGIIFIMLMSTLVMRLIRPFVTECNKYFVTLVITTLFASIFQMFTEAYFLDAYKNIGIYIALCSVNIMLFATAQGGAKKEEKNIVARAFLFSVVFALVVCIVGAVRELLGVGEIKLLSLSSSYLAANKFQILQKAPGAFMMASIVTAVVAFIVKKTGKKKEAN